MQKEKIKTWCKELEAEGFDVTPKSLKVGDDGAAFGCKVDVVRFLNKYDPDESKYPRVKQVFKENLFDVTIAADPDSCFSYGMDVRLENTIEEKENKDDSDDVNDLVASVLEGGELVDKVAELGDVILAKAREHADNIHRLVKEGK